MTATFRADGFRAVKAENAEEAASIFAARQARRDYGPDGHCARLEICPGESDAFVAYISPRERNGNATLGRYLWVRVYH